MVDIKWLSLQPHDKRTTEFEIKQVLLRYTRSPEVAQCVPVRSVTELQRALVN